MRTILFLAMALAANVVCAQNKLTVVVDGIEKSNGKVLVAVYDSINFLKQPLYSGLAKVEPGREEVTIVIDNVASGKYAVSLFHDENDNNRLDTGSYDIPVEKYGFSNNARVNMGPPTFQDCMFNVEEDTEINITLQ
ncbi:MAG: DUF2141 domain-containing protein [Candidatus Azobacteroides sp.]|nr:DUF2141 domain-containing protein [Candidatus Azobacteroides sp.]